MNSIGVYHAKSDSTQNNNSFEFQSAQQTNYGNSTFYKPICKTEEGVGSISRKTKIEEVNSMSPLDVIEPPINNDETHLNENTSLSLCCGCRRQINHVATDSFIEDKQCSTFEIPESRHSYLTENIPTVPGAANEVPTYHENRYTHKDHQETKKRSKLQELLDLKIYRKYGHEKKLKSNIKQEDPPDQTCDKENQKASKKSKRKDIFQRLRKLRDPENITFSHPSNNEWDSKQRKRTELSDASVATVLSLDRVEIIETEYLSRTQPDNLPNDDDCEVRFCFIIRLYPYFCEYYDENIDKKGNLLA